MEKYRISIGEKGLNREEIVGFLAKIFGPNYYDAYTVQGELYDIEPSICPRNFIFSRSLQGELIGIVRIVERSILLGDTVFDAGFISSVGVKPEWRGQGVASCLIRRAVKEMITRGMDISLLYGRRAADGLYPRYGYYGVGRYIDLEIISSINSKDNINAVPFQDENMKICKKMYSATYGDLPGSVVRDRGVWNYLFVRVKMKFGSVKLLMCLVRGKQIGYIVILENKLIEISIPSRFYSAIPQLLRSLDVRVISIHPRHPFFIFCYTHMNTIQKVRFALDGGYMARILNPESFLKKLGSIVVSRAAAVGVSNKVVRLLGYEISLRSGKVSKTSRSNDIIFKKMETAVQFVLGVIPPKDIVGVSWTEKKPWIPYLFPELYFHTSAWDEV